MCSPSALFAGVQRSARVFGCLEGCQLAVDAVDAVGLRSVLVRFGDDGVVSAGHGGVVVVCGFGFDAGFSGTRVFVEELE